MQSKLVAVFGRLSSQDSHQLLGSEFARSVSVHVEDRFQFARPQATTSTHVHQHPFEVGLYDAMTTVEPGRFGGGFRDFFLKSCGDFLCETDENRTKSNSQIGWRQ